MLDKIDLMNPEKLPLSELILHVKKDGIQVKVPALSENWVQPRYYTKYRTLTLVEGKIISDATLEEWINEAGFFNKDLEFMLSLKHFMFWSNLIFDKQCLECIVSFLQEATPFYLNVSTLTTEFRVIEIYQKILNNVLRIICRLITNKESDEEWITNEHHSELLYSKFLISIPMIFDLLIAYGHSNITVLTRIVKSIFKIEPKYNDDLKLSLKFYQKTLKNIQKQNENDGICDGNFSISSSYDDLALYTLDCASTLEILLEIYHEANIICGDIQMEQSISNFYDNTISLLYKNIFTKDASSISLEIINKARISFLKTFRSLINVHVEKVIENPNESIIPAESYIAILTECLADRSFVVDYQKYFPVEHDVEILKQACKELDIFKCDFVLKAYTSEGESYLVDMINEDYENNEQNDNIAAQSQTNENITQSLENMKSLSLYSSRNMENEVNAVLDVLPHLGDGFVRRLLVRYDNPESVVAAVLEGNLPPDLESANQSEPYIPSDVQDTVFMETGVKHYNVFDGDQYDVMTNDKPNCIIKSGKGFPSQPKNITEMLNDKSHIKEMKDRYQEYNLISEDNEYDDEYDDTYEAMADSETKSKRGWFKNRNNDVIDEIEDENDSSSDDDVDENAIGGGNKGGRDTSKDFCENPEVVRARYEANRMAKMSNRGGYKSRDVIGNPKGQGQDKKVLNDRNKKNVHKSSGANHNRKSGAAWKQSRGMIPM